MTSTRRPSTHLKTGWTTSGKIWTLQAALLNKSIIVQVQVQVSNIYVVVVWTNIYVDVRGSGWRPPYVVRCVSEDSHRAFRAQNNVIRQNVNFNIGGGSIYKEGGPEAECRRCQSDGEGLRGGVINLYQLFILK